MTLLERGRRALLAVRLLLARPPNGVERRIYLECWWALIGARLASRRLRRGRLTASSLAPLGSRASRALGPIGPEEQAAVVRAFSRAVATSVVGTPCLARSMALAKVLGRRGASTRVEIGMRKRGHALEGHAWVEAAGRVLGDDETFVSSFVRFERAA